MTRALTDINVSLPPPYRYDEDEIRIIAVRIDREGYGNRGFGYSPGNDYSFYIRAVAHPAAADTLYRTLTRWPASRAPMPPAPIIDPTVKWSAEQKTAREQLRREKETATQELNRVKRELEQTKKELADLKTKYDQLKGTLTRRLPERSAAFPRPVTRFTHLEVY